MGFSVAENLNYTIFDSVRDSISFTVGRTLRQYRGHWCAKSSFVDCDGTPMDWHPFGTLEGPGWVSNAVGGAYEIYRFGRFVKDRSLTDIALSVLDHVLEDGFIDEETGFITGYRDTVEDRFCLNFNHNNDWFCPGSMAKIAYQLLTFSDLLAEPERSDKMRNAAVRCARWLHQNVALCPNGWFPRRATPSGEPYPERADGGPDLIFEQSADGLFVVQCMAELTKRGLADYRDTVREKAQLFVHLGGLFGSINHDTYDEHENVSYAVAFRVLRAAADLIGDDRLKQFAYDTCLKGLDQFKMAEERNDVKTNGLLFMERSWDTAYLWENAEAALAYIEAYGETGNQQYLGDGLTILRAVAQHHHGEYGFLTEGVDWNNAVGRHHHFDDAEFGDIRYTEPFLNNQHIAEPTLEYLEKHAVKRSSRGGDRIDYYVFEGNPICTLSPPETFAGP